MKISPSSFTSLLCSSALASATVASAAHGQTSTAPAEAQATRPATTTTSHLVPPKKDAGGFTITGQLRSRVENWDWFNAPGFNDNYTFSGHQLRLNATRSTPANDITLELQEVILTNLPGNAVAPAPLGALGFGGQYAQANRGQDGSLGIKQAFVRLKNVSGKASNLRLGRFEFNDGTETASKNPTLNWLKTQRLSQRLIGTFGYSDVGRSFDGASFSKPLGANNLTAVVARPTEGVFQLNANDDVDATGFAYGALTVPGRLRETRIFSMAYEDLRSAPKSVKTDNRPLALRNADSQGIRIYTLGADHIRAFQTHSGTWDVLGWGALQTGKWGQLDHSAQAYALELGYQPKGVKLRPWLRTGFYRSSGDGNPADGDHTTFFTPLPTPRTYARFPFYNQMNSQDLFGQVILRPTPKLNLRAEAHQLRLVSGADLWYAGGGAFQDSGFGVSGRPSGGSKNLGTLLDVSADYAVSPLTSLTLYVGQANGGRVVSSIYPNGSNARLAYFELTRKF